MDVIPGTKLAFLVTEDWYFCSHRLELARACVEAGYDVTVVTQVSEHAETIKASNIELVPVVFPRSFRSPWQDMLTLVQIYKAYRRIRPDIVHHVALKPVLYGTLISMLLFSKRPVLAVNAITGLGSLFLAKEPGLSVLRSMFASLLGFFLRRPYSHLIVQNADDAELFKREYNIKPNQLSLIRGSGVDITQFKPGTVNDERTLPVVLLVARMLKDKGIVEFVEAARLINKEGLNARFILVGRLDTQNPSAIQAETIEQWQREQIVEWWQDCSDMLEIYQQADVVVLPSYREGLPKVLLEAAASGLPVVTTDVPGCREIVKHEQNGLLVPIKDSKALAAAIIRLINDPVLRSRLGSCGRKMVETDFSSSTVIAQTQAIYRNHLNSVISS